jgi:hypothetical protein
LRIIKRQLESVIKSLGLSSDGGIVTDTVGIFLEALDEASGEALGP